MTAATFVALALLLIAAGNVVTELRINRLERRIKSLEERP